MKGISDDAVRFGRSPERLDRINCSEPNHAIRDLGFEISGHLSSEEVFDSLNQ